MEKRVLDEITVKNMDGESMNAKVYKLDVFAVKTLKAKYMRINKIVPEGNGIKSMEGVFDFESLSLAVLEKGLDRNVLSELDPEEADDIYNKYYAKYFNPNKGAKEEKN